MIYLKRSKRPARGRAGTAFAVLGLIVLFGIGYFFPRAYPTVLYPITSLFWRSESSSVGFFISMTEVVRSKYGLIVENKRLSDEVAARDRSMLVIDALKSENESLKAALGRTGKGQYALGVILSRPPVSPYDTLIIDIGSAEGVATGDKVYAEGDALVGDIAEVYAHQSKVDLFSTPGRTTPVLVGTSTIAAEATGRGGGNFEVKLPVSASVSRGAVIVTPQIRAHVFGVVDSASVDPTDSLQTVLFKSPVNVSELRFVEVAI